MASLTRSSTGAPTRSRTTARLVAGALTVVATVLGLGLLTAAPASADVFGRWVAYPTTSPIGGPSTWSCSRTESVDTDVLAQFCVVRTADKQKVQGAMIVRNNRSTLYGAEVAFTIQDDLLVYGRFICPRSGVGARTWSVCFGTTWPHPDPIYTYRGGVNGQFVGEAYPEVFI